MLGDVGLDAAGDYDHDLDARVEVRYELAACSWIRESYILKWHEFYAKGVTVDMQRGFGGVVTC